MLESIEPFMEAWQAMSSTQVALMAGGALLFIFVPTFLGLIRNRKHIGKIFLLNIPASFTFTTWLLLCAAVLVKFDSFSDLKERVIRRKKRPIAKG